MAKIGSPLFILRNECEKDLMGVLERLSELGFDGIEFLGFFGHEPGEIKKKLNECGLIAVGNHVPFNDFASNTEKVMDEHLELGCKYITIGPPDKNAMPGGSGYSQTLKEIERIGKAMKQKDMTLLYHNHAEELQNIVAGKSWLGHIMDDTVALSDSVASDNTAALSDSSASGDTVALSSYLSLEPDLGWIQIGGGDPAYYLDKYKDRCPVVHFKDYTPDNSQNGENFLFRPTGYGVMDNASLYAKTLTLPKPPEWYIMDHDAAYGRDIFWDLKISLEFFKNLMNIVSYTNLHLKI